MTSRLRGSQRLAVGAVLAAMALAVLDSGMANVALPHIAKRFSVPPGEAVIVVGAYQAALLAGLLPAAHIAPRVGDRRLFRTGIVMFAAAGACASLASSLPLLVFARALQGLGGAAIMALGIALLRAKLGDSRLPQAIGWNALTVAASAAAGPLVGSILLAWIAPQSLFVTGLPVAAVAFLMASHLDRQPPSGATIDGPSILLHVAAVASFLVAVRLALASPVVAAASLAAAATISWVMVRRSQGQPAPLLPFDLLHRPEFAVQIAASVSCFLAQSAGLIALSFSVQSPPGRGTLATGLLMAAWPLSVASASIVANRPWFRVSPPAQCGAGAATMAAGLVAIALARFGRDSMLLAVGPILCGLGFGLFQLANNRTLFLGSPASRSAAAGAMQGTARLGGQTLGTFLVAALFVGVPQPAAPMAAAAVGAAFAVVAAALGLAAGRMPSAGFSPASRPSLLSC